MINNKLTFLFLLSFTIISINLGCSDCSSDKEMVEIGNTLFSKIFKYSKNFPGAIQVEVRDKNGELLNEVETPYFECIIDGKLTTSNDKLWSFIAEDTRKMSNNGIEHKLVFKGVKGHVNGLEICIIQQVFPESTISREKLEFRVSDKKTFQLNKENGELHFKFPQYGLLSQKDTHPTATEIKLASWELKPITFVGEGQKPSNNHMYYPDIKTSRLENTKPYKVKGPINILRMGQISWMSIYEHASQDNAKGLQRKLEIKDDGKTDAMQGIVGEFDFEISGKDFTFLEIMCQKKEKNIVVSIDAVRGAYLDGEEINSDQPYETVWTASAFYLGDTQEKGKSILRNYLLNQICEHPASRKPEFYYNTWGMQREDKNKPLRGILTYDRIFREIDRAAQLGVDIFVLDDGWNQAHGDWTPNRERLPQGLGPIKERLDQLGIKMGIWLCPMGIDSTTQRYKKHPEWVIKDSNGNPILAQWNHPAFDFVSGFFDLFIEDCKKLIDQGVRYMKWDAINTFYSSLPNLKHGSDKYSKKELRARYEYLLPIFVTRAMKVLTDYEPDLTIEMDLTEARRVMMGLAPLSAGKLFFMNNGASGYNDYSTFRTKSMRTIVNEYAGILPMELLTYANYPQNIQNSMDYNVNTSLIAGHGFWGNLELTNEKERLSVGEKVRKSKLVLPYIKDMDIDVVGKIGDSPEIYGQLNIEESAGQIIAFSETKSEHTYKAQLTGNKLLGVLNHSYKMVGDSLYLDFKFNNDLSTAEAFIIPNKNGGITILSSSSSISNIEVKKDYMKYVLTNPGKQRIRWQKLLGKPKLVNLKHISYSLKEFEDYYEVEIETKKTHQEVILRGEQSNLSKSIIKLSLSRNLSHR